MQYASSAWETIKQFITHSSKSEFSIYVKDGKNRLKKHFYLSFIMLIFIIKMMTHFMTAVLVVPLHHQNMGIGYVWAPIRNSPILFMVSRNGTN